MSNRYLKKYTEDDYKSKCKELNLIYIGNHKKEHSGTMIDFICPIHEDKGVQSKDWSHFRNYKYGCTYCTGRGKTTEDLYKDVNNDSIIFLSDYKGNEKPIMCKCRVCGNEWTTLPKTLVTNKAGCPACGKKKAILGETKTKEELIRQLYEVNPSITILGEYKNTHTKITVQCNICGHIWDGYPANLLNKSAGCPNCNMSLGERMLLNTLTEIGVEYQAQYPIYDGVHKKPLRFDAYGVTNNIAFEYNGEQHYYPVNFSGKGMDHAKKIFELTCERDASKKSYCKQHNIPLIIVPYWKRNNMKQFLLQKEREMNLKFA